MNDQVLRGLFFCSQDAAGPLCSRRFLLSFCVVRCPPNAHNILRGCGAYSCHNSFLQCFTFLLGWHIKFGKPKSCKLYKQIRVTSRANEIEPTLQTNVGDSLNHFRIILLSGCALLLNCRLDIAGFLASAYPLFWPPTAFWPPIPAVQRARLPG